MTKSLTTVFDGLEMQLNHGITKINGPLIQIMGIDFYYLDGKCMNFQEWKQEVRKYYETDEDYLLMLLKLD